MKIETISIRGASEWNEDALVISTEPHVYGVLDGATSVVPFRGPNGETGGYLASNIVSRHLESITLERWSSLSLKEAVLEANAALREAMVESGIDPEEKEQLWTTAIALIRINEQHIDYVQTGDCMIFAAYEDGTIRTVTHDQLAHIDKQTMKRWKECVDRGMTSRAQIRELVEPYIRKNKAKMNTLAGYSAVNGQPELAPLLEHGTINRIQLTALLIITDGLFPYAEEEDTRVDEHLLFAGLQEHGLQGYAEQLIALEESDPECQKYIRFKKSDDKTAVWIRF